MKEKQKPAQSKRGRAGQGLLEERKQVRSWGAVLGSRRCSTEVFPDGVTEHKSIAHAQCTEREGAQLPQSTGVGTTGAMSLSMH